MFHVWGPLGIAAAFAVCLAFPAAAAAEPFQVIKIYDGDTIRVRGHGAEIRVRLAGIDAPELAEGPGEQTQPYGPEARDYLEIRLLDRWVELEQAGLEGLDLYLARVRVEGKEINLEMLAAGLAEISSQDPPPDERLADYQAAQAKARAEGRGIWGLGKRYVSPWQWRQWEEDKSAAALLLLGLYGQKWK